MNIYEMMEKMGTCASEEQAERMLGLLKEKGITDTDISEMPEDDWLRLMDEAIESPATKARQTWKGGWSSPAS